MTQALFVTFLRGGQIKLLPLNAPSRTRLHPTSHVLRRDVDVLLLIFNFSLLDDLVRVGGVVHLYSIVIFRDRLHLLDLDLCDADQGCHFIPLHNCLVLLLTVLLRGISSTWEILLDFH